MKKLLLITLIFCCGLVSFAQVGIGTTSPNANAALDITNTTKGVLLPRVALTSTTSAAPLSAHVAGMLVYNTATAGSGATAVTPGFYINNGSNWNSISSLALANNGTVSNLACGSVAFSYNGAIVNYGTVVSPTTGQCFLDRNLGASQAATAYNDYRAYGDLFQWGRPADGHQLTSWTGSSNGSSVNGTTATLATSDYPNNSLFITPSASPYDWRSNNNNQRWSTIPQGPCPSDWHVPTHPEWQAETGIIDYSTAYSQLKLTTAGYRYYVDGSIPGFPPSGAGYKGYYWSSTYSTTKAFALTFYSVANYGEIDERAYGFSVRCTHD